MMGMDIYPRPPSSMDNQMEPPSKRINISKDKPILTHINKSSPPPPLPSALTDQNHQEILDPARSCPKNEDLITPPSVPTTSPGDNNPCSNPANVVGKVYCLCRKPDGDRCPMVMCDWCKEWFHHDCIGMTVDEIEKVEELGEEWLCQYCSEQAPRPTSGPFSDPPRLRRISSASSTPSTNNPGIPPKIYSSSMDPDSSSARTTRARARQSSIEIKVPGPPSLTHSAKRRAFGNSPDSYATAVHSSPSPKTSNRTHDGPISDRSSLQSHTSIPPRANSSLTSPTSSNPGSPTANHKRAAVPCKRRAPSHHEQAFHDNASRTEHVIFTSERNSRMKIAELLIKALESFLNKPPCSNELAAREQLNHDILSLRTDKMDSVVPDKVFSRSEIIALGNDLESALYDKYAPSPEPPKGAPNAAVKFRTKPLIGTQQEAGYRQQARVLMSKLKTDRSDALRSKLRAGVWTPLDVIVADPNEFSFDTAREYRAARAKTLASSIRTSRDDDVLVRKTHKGDVEVHRASVAGLADDADIQYTGSTNSRRQSTDDLPQLPSRTASRDSFGSSRASRDSSAMDMFSTKPSNFSISALAKGPMIIAEDAVSRSRSETVFQLPTVHDDVDELVHRSSSAAASKLNDSTHFSTEVHDNFFHPGTNGSMANGMSPNVSRPSSAHGSPENLLLDEDDDSIILIHNDHDDMIDADAEVSSSRNGPSLAAAEPKFKFQDAVSFLLKDSNDDEDEDLHHRIVYSPARSSTASPEPPEAPVAEVRMEVDASISWIGSIMHVPEPGQSVHARFIQIGGRPIALELPPTVSPLSIWLAHYFTPELYVDGRLSKRRADEYLCNLHHAPTCELFLFEIQTSAYTDRHASSHDQRAINTLFKQLHDTRRYAVVQCAGNPHDRPPEQIRFKDLYLLCLRPEDPVPSWCAQFPNSISGMRSCNVMLAVLVGSNKFPLHPARPPSRGSSSSVGSVSTAVPSFAGQHSQSPLRNTPHDPGFTSSSWASQQQHDAGSAPAQPADPWASVSRDQHASASSFDDDPWAAESSSDPKPTHPANEPFRNTHSAPSMNAPFRDTHYTSIGTSQSANSYMSPQATGSNQWGNSARPLQASASPGSSQWGNTSMSHQASAAPANSQWGNNSFPQQVSTPSENSQWSNTSIPPQALVTSANSQWGNCSMPSHASMQITSSTSADIDPWADPWAEDDDPPVSRATAPAASTTLPIESDTHRVVPPTVAVPPTINQGPAASGSGDLMSQIPAMFQRLFPDLPPLDMSKDPPPGLMQLLLQHINDSQSSTPRVASWSQSPQGGHAHSSNHQLRRS